MSKTVIVHWSAHINLFHIDAVFDFNEINTKECKSSSVIIRETSAIVSHTRQVFSFTWNEMEELRGER